MFERAVGRRMPGRRRFAHGLGVGVCCRAGVLVVALAVVVASVASARDAGRITGVGGVFVVSKDPKALVAWYRDVLGISMESWGGAMLRYDAAGHPPMAVWTAFPAGSDELAPSKREFMINFGVDDLDAFVARLRGKGVVILKREADRTGKFAWIMDPDGTKIELWQAAGE